MESSLATSSELAGLIAEETLILAATELLSVEMQKQGVSKKVLAERLGVSQAEITQRLSGRRNLTLRSLANMFHVLDLTVDVEVAKPSRREESTSVSRRAKTFAIPSKKSLRPLSLIQGASPGVLTIPNSPSMWRQGLSSPASRVDAVAG